MLSAELVAACLDDRAEAIRSASSSSTPQAFASKTDPSGIGTSVTSPQSVHTTPSKPKRPRSSPVITRLVEAEADGLELGSDRTAVVGHDLRCPGGESGLEGPQVVLEALAWIDLVLAVGKVRVLAVGLRAATREVLRHAARRSSGPARRPGSRGCTPRSSRQRARSPRRTCRRYAPTAARSRRQPSGAAQRGYRRRDIPAGRSRRSCARAPRHRSRRARSARATARTSRVDQLATAFSSKAWRGSDEIVTGMPSRVSRRAAAAGCATRPAGARPGSRRC